MTAAASVGFPIVICAKCTIANSSDAQKNLELCSNECQAVILSTFIF